MAGNVDTGHSAAGEFTGSGGVLNVRGVKYAIGLVWEAVADQSKPILKQARESAHRNGADLICIRKPSKVQYGLGSTKFGHKKGQAPLASLVAEVIEGSFIGAFETEGGYYLVAARDDQILPGCDRVITDRQEATDAFADLFYGATWDQTICPKDFGIEGTLSTALEVTVGGVRAKAKLEPSSSKELLVKIGAAVVLLALAYGGYSYYQSVQQADRDEAIRIEAQRARDQAAADKLKVPPDAPYPWEAKPIGVFAMNACVDAILGVNLSAAGWRPLAVTCGDGHVVASFKRSGGTINWALATLGQSDPKPRMHWDHDTITADWDVPAVQTYAKGVTTKPVSDTLRYLTSTWDEFFQIVNTKATVIMPPPPPQSRSGSSGPPPPVIPPYGMLAISFNTSQNPKDYARILAAIPVFVMTSLKYDLTSGIWSFEGNAYEQLPNPHAAAAGRPGVPPAR